MKIQDTTKHRTAFLVVFRKTRAIVQYHILSCFTQYSRPNVDIRKHGIHSIYIPLRNIRCYRIYLTDCRTIIGRRTIIDRRVIIDCRAITHSGCTRIEKNGDRGSLRSPHHSDARRHPEVIKIVLFY